MGIRQVVYSDISGAEIPDEQHARIVVTEHPDLRSAVELDVTKDEADKFQSSSLRMVSMTVYAPNEPSRRVLAETKTLDRLFTGVEFEKVLEGARKADTAPAEPRQRRQRAVAAPKRERLDYTSLDHAGRPHRGRITDAERETVRGNLEAINKRLIQEGLPSIDKNDPRMKEKWGF